MNDQITINRQTIANEQKKFSTLVRQLELVEIAIKNIVDYDKIQDERIMELEKRLRSLQGDVIGLNKPNVIKNKWNEDV